MIPIHAQPPIRDDSFAALITHAASFFYGERIAVDFIYSLSRICEFKTYFRDFLTNAIQLDAAGILLLYPKATEDKEFDRAFSSFIEKGILVPAATTDGWILPKQAKSSDVFEAIAALFAVKKKFRKRVKYFFSFELLFCEAYRDKIFFALLLLTIEHVDRSRNVQFIEEIGDIFNKDLKNTLLILAENRSFGFEKLAVPAKIISAFPEVIDSAVFVAEDKGEKSVDGGEDQVFSIKSRNINQILLTIAGLILSDIPIKII
ncbi:hypothetical protein FBY58_0170 [Zymomonas mobilis]|uniref:Uncharacterized protein n=1 Tax=Zymomonas mobilis TaxID=542 RepID=A0A542VZ86_ZYMMB|nr:hypothetical protein [Zymomonas mobilis]TQL16634.1 hypothetical protein FBY58_0170 [Zymomonas mobilis]